LLLIRVDHREVCPFPGYRDEIIQGFRTVENVIETIENQSLDPDNYRERRSKNQ